MAKNAHKVQIKKGDTTCWVLPESVPVWEDMEWKQVSVKDAKEAGVEPEALEAAKAQKEAAKKSE